jgi:predicted NBD/HSP70 family sugar kinase
VLDLRKRSRAAVLRLLLLDGTATRVGLAAQTGVSAATVSNVVGDLLAEGLIVEGGVEESGGGRPRTELHVNPDAGRVVGVDLSERSLVVGLFDLALRPIDQVTAPVRAAKSPPAEVAARLDEAIDDLLGRQTGEVLLRGVGIGVPGVVEHAPGPVVHAQVLNWDGVQFGQLLADRGAPVIVDNAAKALTRAEMWFGAARHVRHAIVVLLTTEVGAGVIADGEIYHGVRGSAAEWGHTKVEVRGRKCRCGARGCLEAYVGARAVMANWRGIAAGPAPRAPKAAIAGWLDAVRSGDRGALSVLADVVDVLGAGLGDLVNLYNPEKILIGGWLGKRIGSVALDRIDRAMRANALDAPAAEVSLELCRVESYAVARGAAIFPVERVIEQRDRRAAG